MRKKLIFFTVLFALILPLALSATVNARGKKNPHPQAVVYVTSQGLFYDSIVLTDFATQWSFSAS